MTAYPNIEIRSQSITERLSRGLFWPIYIPRIYFAVRYLPINKTRWKTLRFASKWFHCWVWNYAELPW